MERALIGVEGQADRLLMRGLLELSPLIEALEGSVLVIGGLMTRAWLHARPLSEIPPRATADVDLGVNRRSLRITADTKILGPKLRELDFEPKLGDEAFRFSKELGEGLVFSVDLVVAPGASRHEPPLLERDMPTVAAPGLAYALRRGTEVFELEFVDGQHSHSFQLPLPQLDASFVLKGALVKRGVRMRPDRRMRDTVDAITLGAICLSDDGALEQLRRNRRRSEVRDALRWLDGATSPTSAPARLVEAHFAERGVKGTASWAAGVARELRRETR